jgi:glycosyltransferase involved in cell wall biosynthesis
MLVLADFPKPIHGMSAMNVKIVEKLGGGVEVVNSCPSFFHRFFGTRWWYVAKFFYSTFILFKVIFLFIRNRYSVFYRPINGGFGQLFDVFYIGVARFFGARIYIHHHSFQYLNRKSYIFNFLNNIAGEEAVHISLGGDMSEKLEVIYSIGNNRIRVVSNSSFFDDSCNEPSCTKGDRMLSVSHMSNLCLEKGIGRYAEICYELQNLGMSFVALLAGPVLNVETQNVLNDMQKRLTNFVYLGPVYGQDKFDFFKKSDVFVFMSEYENEAEPLVLYEAAAQGAKIYCTQRGCMKDVARQIKGQSFASGYTPGIIAQKIICDYKNGSIEGLKSERLINYYGLVKSNKSTLEALIKEMKSEYSKTI